MKPARMRWLIVQDGDFWKVGFFNELDVIQLLDNRWSKLEMAKAFLAKNEMVEWKRESEVAEAMLEGCRERNKELEERTREAEDTLNRIEKCLAEYSAED